MLIKSLAGKIMFIDEPLPFVKEFINHSCYAERIKKKKSGKIKYSQNGIGQADKDEN